MMNVQRMRRIVDVVQTNAIPHIVQIAAACWQIDGLTYFRSSANHLFRGMIGNNPVFLRLAHEQDRSESAIRAELDLIAYLKTAKIPVVTALQSVNSLFVERVKYENETYFAVAFQQLHGEQFESEALTLNMYTALGHTLARLHEATSIISFSIDRPTWYVEIERLLMTLPSSEAQIANVLQTGLRWLNSIPAHDTSLIHGDFELDNLVFDGDMIYVLDFDDSVYAPEIVDIAIALGDVWSDASMESQESIQLFLKAYGDVRSLPNDLEKNTPFVLNLVSAIKMARLLHAYHDFEKADAPEWALQLHEYHENWLAKKRALLDGNRLD